MQSLWNDQEAATFIQSNNNQRATDLGLRVYTSQLLGRDTSLVLHGGGNTSVKIREKNIFGVEEDILYIKGSGWDLATIQEAGFSPVRMDHLLKLAQLDSLSDPMMVKEMRMHMTNPAAPAPSVETILHAVLPFKYVDHTHTDAVITVMNTAKGRAFIDEIYGDSVVVIPYVMPGFDLARVVAEEFPKQSNPNTIGMILMNHGVFSFGETAQESYERMIHLVDLAERFLQKKKAWDLPSPAQLPSNQKTLRHDLAALRKSIADCAGFPMILSMQDSPRALAFANHPQVHNLSQQGPATPDHVIRTKQLPMLGRDVQAYQHAYETYFATHAPYAKEKKSILDRAPRIILDPEFGLCTVGKTAKDAAIVAEIYEHTIDIILRGTLLDGYQALPANDIFDVEYWELEQAKLRSGGKTLPFTGEIVLITGAASGIGKASVESFLARGAAVIGLDVNESISTLFNRPDFLGIQCDVTDETAVTTALEQAVRRFGGIDMLILNAGIFPKSKKIAELSKEEWRRVMGINMDANLILLREMHPFLKLSPRGGRVVIIGSKNVSAPGPGASAYSASKAAVNQLMRVAALEWGEDGIRVNTIHPNAVFDTAIWSQDVLESRARSYALSIEDYKKNNILRVEVTSHDVAELATEMCGPLFAKTTAAQVPVDGGNERVI